MWKGSKPDSCISHCATQATLKDAIIKAAYSIDHIGKKHPHQYRIKREVLKNFSDSIIQHINAISKANNFTELITIIQSSKVKGIGELAVYDISVRVGGFLNIWPDRIYLHAGAKTGALALNLNITSDVISRDDLPLELKDSDLSCYELEDILCIYKKMFAHIKN